MEEMKTLNQAANERMKRIEDSSQTFEKMILELHNNNKAKSEEMAQYERRLTQIGDNTSSRATKVDKLSLAMKSFINVMTDFMGPKNSKVYGSQERQEHLLQLASYLDEDDDMVVDPPNTQPPPGPSEVLRGEDSKK